MEERIAKKNRNQDNAKQTQGKSSKINRKSTLSSIPYPVQVLQQELVHKKQPPPPPPKPTKALKSQNEKLIMNEEPPQAPPRLNIRKKKQLISS